MFETLSSPRSSAHSPGLKADIKSGGITHYLAVRLGNLWRRHKLTRLERLDDALLVDIGLVRSDLIWARHLGLGTNPLQALQQAARQRSHEYRQALARKAVR